MLLNANPMGVFPDLEEASTYGEATWHMQYPDISNIQGSVSAAD